MKISRKRIKNGLQTAATEIMEEVRVLLPALADIVSRGMSFFWFAFFIGAGLTPGFFFTIFLIQR